MPAHGGTTCRFMRPRALQPPTIQLGNSGIDPPAQVPQRDIIDATMAFFGLVNYSAENELTCNYERTGCIINEQVILQDLLYNWSWLNLAKCWNLLKLLVRIYYRMI